MSHTPMDEDSNNALYFRGPEGLYELGVKTVPVLFISGNIEFLESIKELKQKDSHIDHLSKPCKNMGYIGSINTLLAKSPV